MYLFIGRTLAITTAAIALALGIHATEESTHPPHAERPNGGRQYTLTQTIDPAVLHSAEAGSLMDYLTHIDSVEKLGRYLGALEDVHRRVVAGQTSERNDVAAPAPVAASGNCAIPAHICQRESGFNPAAVNPNGHYGKYQFSQSTWNNTVASMGRGDLVGANPATVDEASQDAAAAYLWGDGSGCSHWAAC